MPQKNLFDTIRTIDILDCNAGSHGKAFATNFNPEINIREVTPAGPVLGKAPLDRDPADHRRGQHPLHAQIPRRRHL